MPATVSSARSAARCRRRRSISVAADGLRYTRFHTTALCSPTRAALLTGRNHHSTGNGVITEAATGYDGYTGIIGKNVGTIAEVLRQYGYATAWFGKNHNTPDWETSQVGPFDRWPSGLGFDYFYGFMGGDMDQWQPTLYENHELVPRSSDPNYILTPDLVDHAIAWLRRTRSHRGRQAVLPLHVDRRDARAAPGFAASIIAQVQGQVRHGLGRVPRADVRAAEEARRRPAEREADASGPTELPAWDSLSADQKKLFARMMEVFAAFTDQTDYEMGRLLDVVRSLPDADNTIIFYEVGDNGASAEGGLVGLLNENSFFNNVPESLEDNLKHIDELGGPKHFNHFPAGWAWAMNTPFQWTKQIASHLGGVRNPLAVSWPAKIKDKGGVRAQFHHVIDIAPTIYEAVGIPFPDILNGVAQKPIEGVSMVYSFDYAKAPGPPPHAVLRDVHQPRHLPRRLVGGVARRTFRGKATPTPADPGHGDVGAVQPRRGFQPGERSRQRRTRRSCASCRTCGGRRRRATTCCRSTAARRSGSTPSCRAGRR